MPESDFTKLKHVYSQLGIEGVLDRLATSLGDQKRYHELFEVLKMKLRRRLGLPLMYQDEGDELDGQQRRELEDGLLDACREVGTRLISEGKIRDGWMYLRPVGEKQAVLRLLEAQPVTEDNVEQFIEVLLHEGIDVQRGYQLVLDHYGTCNAITTIQSALYGRAKSDRSAAGKLLVRHVHRELLDNVQAHIQRQEGSVPTSRRLSELVEPRPWLFADGAYHLDTSHLSSTVQVAGELTDQESLELGFDLTAYGRRLDEQLQYAGDEPFVDLYPSYALYFGAQLGTDVEEAVAYFRDKAQAARPREEGTTAIEVYLDLLSRLGRIDEAIEATVALIPEGIQTTGRSPSLFDLCQSPEQYVRLQEICQQREDVLGYAVALMAGDADAAVR